MASSFFNELIKQCISQKRPMSFGKLGAVETDVLTNSHTQQRVVWGQNLGINAGVFPLDQKTVDRWVVEYTNAIRSLDACVEWWHEKDTFLLKRYNPTRLISNEIDDLLPFNLGRDAWHYSLSDKTVLVVHPMMNTIHAQVKNFSALWPGAGIKEMIGVKSFYPPWLTGDHPFSNFFDCLAAMKDEIAKHQFDFAVVGAGAYSLLLLEFIKELGVPCVHLGGQTQLLFGIRGKRWETEYTDSWREANFYNNSKYWTRPLAIDVPNNKDSVENGCYW
jgi:hypothetical protein